MKTKLGLFAFDTGLADHASPGGMSFAHHGAELLWSAGDHKDARGAQGFHRLRILEDLYSLRIEARHHLARRRRRNQHSVPERQAAGVESLKALRLEALHPGQLV